MHYLLFLTKYVYSFVGCISVNIKLGCTPGQLSALKGKTLSENSKREICQEPTFYFDDVENQVIALILLKEI